MTRLPLDPPMSARAIRAEAKRRGVAAPRAAEMHAAAPTRPATATTPRHAPEMPLTLRLPMPINVANARLHWAKKDRARRLYFDMCDAVRLVYRFPEPPSPVFDPAVIAITLHVWNYMDDDNAMARVKWPVDWLVSRGYLAGDSRKHLRWSGVPEQRIDRRENAMLTITLRAAPVGEAGE